MALRKGQKSNEMADRVQNIADHLAHFVGGAAAGSARHDWDGWQNDGSNARHGAWRNDGLDHNLIALILVLIVAAIVSIGRSIPNGRGGRAR